MTYTVDDKMKTLLAAPEAVAVLERFFPKILKNPALQMTAAMTLRQVAGADGGIARGDRRTVARAPVVRRLSLFSCPRFSPGVVCCRDTDDAF